MHARSTPIEPMHVVSAHCGIPYLLLNVTCHSNFLSHIFRLLQCQPCHYTQYSVMINSHVLDDRLNRIPFVISTGSLTIASGLSAATFSMSTPPSALAIIAGPFAREALSCRKQCRNCHLQYLHGPVEHNGKVILSP